MITSPRKALVPCFVAAIAAFLQPATAATTVTVHDWGSTTYDSSTSLEWLDLSFTAGKSYLEVAGGWGEFTTTGGYRFATRSEVIELFLHAGGASIDPPQGDPVPENLAAAELLLALLGDTYPELNRSWMTYDPATEPTRPPTHSPVAVFGAGDVRSGYPDEGFMLVPGLFPTLDYGAPHISSALVRVVPEPSAAALLASGLACLSWVRRRWGC